MPIGDQNDVKSLSKSRRHVLCATRWRNMVIPKRQTGKMVLPGYVKRIKRWNAKYCGITKAYVLNGMVDICGGLSAPTPFTASIWADCQSNGGNNNSGGQLPRPYGPY